MRSCKLFGFIHKLGDGTAVFEACELLTALAGLGEPREIEKLTIEPRLVRLDRNHAAVALARPMEQGAGSLGASFLCIVGG